MNECFEKVVPTDVGKFRIVLCCRVQKYLVFWDRAKLKENSSSFFHALLFFLPFSKIDDQNRTKYVVCDFSRGRGAQIFLDLNFSILSLLFRTHSSGQLQNSLLLSKCLFETFVQKPFRINIYVTCWFE